MVILANRLSNSVSCLEREWGGVTESRSHIKSIEKGNGVETSLHDSLCHTC